MLTEKVVLGALLDRVEKSFIEKGARQDFGLLVEDDIGLEKQAEQVLKQGAEVRKKRAAAFFQLLERGRLGTELPINAPVIRVIFDPRGISRQGLKDSLRGSCLTTPRGH
ncbi:MAG TPA: hypothetical protein VLR92_07175 [Blastocatellia bacterium]|nr:hypothetical protein [Blastocatellia bacterium]